MALPTKAQLEGMSYSKDGTPHVRVASKAGQDADGLAYSKDGTPFWFTEEASVSGTNMQINIGDTWKTVDSMQINIGDTWKPVTQALINIGDVWKSIF